MCIIQYDLSHVRHMIKSAWVKSCSVTSWTPMWVNLCWCQRHSFSKCMQWVKGEKQWVKGEKQLVGKVPSFAFFDKVRAMIPSSEVLLLHYPPYMNLPWYENSLCLQHIPRWTHTCRERLKNKLFYIIELLCHTEFQ